MRRQNPFPKWCPLIRHNSVEEKSYKDKYRNILIYDISHKTLMGSKQLRITFNKIDGFIKIFDGIRYLVLYDYKRYNAIYDRIRYLISEKKCY